MKKLKIALVYDAIYPYVKGGGERRFYELGTRLAKAGHEVHWYGMKFWDGPKTIEHDGIILHGLCKARPLYTKSGRRSIPQALIFGLSSFKLLFVDFDVMDCCGFPYTSLFPAKIATKIRRKPLFATWYEVWGKDYWQEYVGKIGLIGYWIERMAVKMPTHIITISTHTETLLKSRLKVKPHTIIPNGIDAQYIASVAPSKDNIDVLYVGRLMNFKQVDLIIKALAQLKTEKTLLRFVVIGKGPEEKYLKDLSVKLGVAEQIKWLHSLNTKDLYSYMKAAKVLILPSKREGFGMVVLEANACGTPVITNLFSENAAKDLIVEGKNGFTFNPKSNPNYLAATIQKTLNCSKEMESDCIDFAKNYDWSSLANSLHRAYSL